MNAIQPFDPARGFLNIQAQRLGPLLADFVIGRHTVRVVGLVVDDHQILGSGQLP